MTMKKLLLILLAVMSCAVIFVKCGGGGGGDGNGNSVDGVNTIILSGKLSSDYQVAQKRSENFFSRIFNSSDKAYASLADGKVDKIIAIPAKDGGLYPEKMKYGFSTSISSDGTFSLNLDTYYNWMLVLMDTSAVTINEKFSGYVALKADAIESLLILPTTTASVSELDLGTVSSSSDLALSENTVGTTQFSMTESELLSLAKNDELMKSVKNMVLNYDRDNDLFYHLEPAFYFYGDYSSIENSFTNVSSYQFEYYGFIIHSNQTAVTMDDICGNGVPQVSLELYPPPLTNISTSNPAVVYNESNPISNSGATCITNEDGFVEASATDFYASNSTGEISVGFGNNITTRVIPDGYWKYKVDGDTKGEFDIAVAVPVTADGKVNSLAPALRVNTDSATGIINSIDIKWYYLDGSGSYVELTDIKALKHLVGSVDFGIAKRSSAPYRYESYLIDPSEQTSVTPVKTWYFGNKGVADERAENFYIGFGSGGLSSAIEYRL